MVYPCGGVTGAVDILAKAHTASQGLAWRGQYQNKKLENFPRANFEKGRRRKRKFYETRCVPKAYGLLDGRQVWRIVSALEKRYGEG